MYAQSTTTVMTDHLNHSFLAGKSKLSYKQTSALDELAPFDFRIEYRPGKANPADALSRRADHRDSVAIEHEKTSCVAEFLQRFRSEE